MVEPFRDLDIEIYLTIKDKYDIKESVQKEAISLIIAHRLILGISAEEYCRSIGKDLGDFTIEGVHVFGAVNPKVSPKEVLAKRVPDRTAVIVNYRINFAGSDCFEANGDALVWGEE